MTLTVNSTLTAFSSRFSAAIFLLGKVLRFIFFGIFLIALVGQVKMLASYTLFQAAFFYLAFNLMDTITQLFFREVYRFRQLVVSGEFDLVLSKPMSPLFRALVGGADPLDLLMLIPYIGMLLYVGRLLEGISFPNAFLFLFLFANGFLVATACHIIVLAMGVVTTEIDHAVMIYRDLTSMGRVPVDIYREPIRGIITFVIPVGLMMTFPVKALLGLLSPQVIILSFVLGFSFFIFSLRIWKYALTRYSSASS